MRQLMKLAKERSVEGMFPIVEEMLKKTKLLCSIPDTVLMEEALMFLEDNKITKRPEKDEFSESVSEFMQRNKLKIDIVSKPNCGSLQTPCTEFVCKVNRAQIKMFIYSVAHFRSCRPPILTTREHPEPTSGGGTQSTPAATSQWTGSATSTSSRRSSRPGSRRKGARAWSWDSLTWRIS